MKCAKCGAELKVGCLYCAVCGQEAQIVSESNLLEEELLRELLKEETPSSQEVERTKKRNHKPLIISVISAITLLVVCIAVIMVIRNQNNNSYEYQILKAEEYTEESNYVKALAYYKRALELKENDIEARFRMVEVHLVMEEEDKAISLLHEIISLDSFNQEAYQQLISLYAQKKDYEAILDLKANRKDDSLLELFADYDALPPKFSLEPGTYPDYISIELTAEEGCQIYYTTDGSDPIANGQPYEAPVKLEEQSSVEIQAVSCNEYGLYSEIVTGKYTVKFDKPQMAVATPDSGSFSQPTTIELSGPEGSHIYYTWDGTDPTVASLEYTVPIEVPEGNNILSVILVDKYGMYSDVLKCNYKYFP